MLFSVIIPIYKMEAFLTKCIDSILAQSCPDFELLLVDDGSPDGCPAICDAYAETDGRVRVLHKENGGVVSARNAGLQMARGQYICYVDGDDWVLPNWLEALKDMIRVSPVKPDILAFGARMVFEDHEETIASSLEEGFYDKERLKKEVYPFLISDRRLFFGREIIFSVAWNKAYKRSLLQRFYCRDERLTIGEDTAFTLNCFLHARHAYISKEVFYSYNRTNEESALNVYNPRRIEAICTAFRYISATLPKNRVIQKQLNDHYAKRILAGVFHEMAAGRPIDEAVKTLSVSFKKTGIMRFVTMKGLPLPIGAFILLLRLRMYRTALLLSREWLRRNPTAGV